MDAAIQAIGNGSTVFEFFCFFFVGFWWAGLAKGSVISAEIELRHPIESRTFFEGPIYIYIC